MSPLWGSMMYVSCVSSESAVEEEGGWRVLTRGERGVVRACDVEEEEEVDPDIDHSASPDVLLRACSRPSTDATSSISSRCREDSLESSVLEEWWGWSRASYVRRRGARSVICVVGGRWWETISAYDAAMRTRKHRMLVSGAMSCHRFMGRTTTEEVRV